MAMDQAKIPHPGPNDQVPATPPVATEHERSWNDFMSLFQSKAHMRRHKRSSSNDNSSLPASDSANPDVSSTPITSTASPGCRERKTVEKAFKSTFLSEVDFSRVTEMCMGMNELPFTKLWDIMGAIAKLRNKESPQTLQANKEDHAKEEISRLTLGQYLTVSDGTKTICMGPNPKLEGNSMYKLIENVEIDDDGFPMGLSLYLVTGWNRHHGAVTWERVIVNSSMDEMATIFLGTTDMWRLTGDLKLNCKVKDQQEISIDMDGLGMTLSRQVTEWSVLYTVEVRVDVVNSHHYDGLLWGIFAALGSDDTTSLGNHKCYPLTTDPTAMSQYKGSPLEFTHYFVDLLYDLTKNLPPYMFDE